MKKTFRNGTQRTYHQLSLPSLPQLLRLSPKVVERCRARHDLKGVFEMCVLNRAAWDAYLREFQKSGAAKYRNTLFREMDAGCEAVAAVIPDLTGRDRKDARRALANIEQRRHFTNTLHHYGPDALEAELLASLR